MLEIIWCSTSMCFQQLPIRVGFTDVDVKPAITGCFDNDLIRDYLTLVFCPWSRCLHWWWSVNANPRETGGHWLLCCSSLDPFVHRSLLFIVLYMVVVSLVELDLSTAIQCWQAIQRTCYVLAICNEFCGQVDFWSVVLSIYHHIARWLES